MFERIVVVKKKTPLEEILERHYSRSQADFYLNSRGLSLAEYEASDKQYRESLAVVKRALPSDTPHLEIFREAIATFQFRRTDLVIAVGPDGLCINVAKYLEGQPLLAVNSDTQRNDGKLARFTPKQAAGLLPSIMQGRFSVDEVTLAQAVTNDGQTLYAVNDFMVGRKDQVSARYTVEFDGHKERQSSSGILVSTGVGSSGWLTSVIAGVRGMMKGIIAAIGVPEQDLMLSKIAPFPWDARYLFFVVREPFPSQYTSADLVVGMIKHGNELRVTSEMPEHGVIFSDGVLEDFLEFNSGTVLTISVADRTARFIRN